MPLLTPMVVRASPTTPKPRGTIPRYAWDTAGKGKPRTDDVMRIRMLEDTPAIALPMNTVLSQLTGSEWEVQPDEEFEGSAQHAQAAEEISKWLQGKFNSNEESWDAFQAAWARDILSIGSGVVELVWDDARTATREMYVRDAGVFTKHLDKYGRIPARDSVDEQGKHRPAYWQWGGSVMAGNFQRRSTSPEVMQHEASPYLYNIMSIQPTSFERDEIMWTDLNPRSWEPYGHGRVADAAILAEIVLNMTLYNRSYFGEQEMPEGILGISGAGQGEVQAIIDYWKAEIAGRPNKVAILGAPAGIHWQPFRGTMKELQFLQSNEHYLKLIWMLFGLNANEVGDIAEVTRPGGTKQFSADVWRKTTMPLLSLMQEDINRQLLPHLEPFIRVGGGLHFKYSISHPDAEDQMRARQDRDIEVGAITINDALRERGQEPVPWGDMPRALMQQLITAQPEWFYTHFVVMENKPEPPDRPSMPGLLGLSQRSFPDPMMQHKDAAEDEQVEPVPDDVDAEGEKDPVWRAAVHMMQDTEAGIKTALREWFASIKEEWPQKSKAFGLPLSAMVLRLVIADMLREAIERGATAVMIEQMGRDAAELAEEIRIRTGEAVEITARPPSPDGPAMVFLRQRAATASIAVQDDVRSQLATILTEAADGGWGIQRLTEAFDARVPEISHAKSRLIARTEVMQARRNGAQAFAEGVDVVAGKMWDATKDNRTRKWHTAMHGVTVPKNGHFTVPRVSPEQDESWPRDTYVVGGSDPYNCRCRQRHVLREDMPSDIRELCARYPEVKRLA